MADEIAAIQYLFLVKTSLYSHVSQLDSDLAEFFGNKEMQARIVKTVGGQYGMRLMVIEQIDSLKPKESPVKIQRPSDTNLERMRKEIKEPSRIKKGTVSKIRVKEMPRKRLEYQASKEFRMKKIKPKLGGYR